MYWKDTKVEIYIGKLFWYIQHQKKILYHPDCNEVNHNKYVNKIKINYLMVFQKTKKKI